MPAAQLTVVPPLPRRLVLADLKYFLPGVVPLEMAPSPLLELPATVMRFGSAEEARGVLRRGVDFSINNDNFTLFQTFWTSEERTSPAGDAVAPSRFADSQELRYSLRSLERFAPWVRRVYLVTNGQIPDWLALDSARLTLVTHEEIFPDASHLPTFSSPAIEAHLHRITGLSERFLYFNDDVLLGRPVWPEDFYTSGDGYSVRLAWRLPDCATGCASLWLRDGHCDAACNTLLCDWDGGDCADGAPEPRTDGDAPSTPADADGDALLPPDDEDACATGCGDSWLGDRFCDKMCDVAACAHDLGDCGAVARLGRLLNASGVWDAELERRLRAAERRLPDRSGLLRRRLELLVRAVGVPSNITSWRPSNPEPVGNTSASERVSRRLLAVEPAGRPASSDAPTVHPAGGASTGRRAPDPEPGDASSSGRRALDTYGASLLHVNRLYTRRYGAEQRRAVAHMPHMLERAIVAELQAAFADEFVRTSAARVRSPTDMQFAFAYFYYLMSERVRAPAGQIFDELDTDGSGTWSDREVRTLMTRLRPLPLTLRDMERTWALLRDCARRAPPEPELSTPPGERYLDSDLPTVSRAAVLACGELAEELERALGGRPRFPHRVLPADDVTFTMVRGNASHLVAELDAVRRAPRRFLCLNNNVGAAPPAELRLVYALLVDFLEALLPRPSQFELPANYRNRFQHVAELRVWERHRRWLRAATALLALLLLATLLHAQLQRLLRALHRRCAGGRRRRAAQDV
ncbi:N-acetylglucosamine-1-phosphotransferase subunits alpha/beta-like [Pollicipes pollicipes]|uniref:N-acetylglucosamine-1-phosphotransferase subunits alpha/beta-like n=1 Tax=Pollicipes pollicipes TaxID=41117 RepID=UPI001884FCFE|nr:N-acetylglucosamine-1-phosphotransferase subunits alpha/beta-like [Pollicipes pollicipes]